jgi:hypothetical protein
VKRHSHAIYLRELYSAHASALVLFSSVFDCVVCTVGADDEPFRDGC